MRWGLIPYWAKDIKIGFSTINARAEEVETKPAQQALHRAYQLKMPAGRKRMQVLNGSHERMPRRATRGPFGARCGSAIIVPCVDAPALPPTSVRSRLRSVARFVGRAILSEVTRLSLNVDPTLKGRSRISKQFMALRPASAHSRHRPSAPVPAADIPLRPVTGKRQWRKGSISGCCGRFQWAALAGERAATRLA